MLYGLVSPLRPSHKRLNRAKHTSKVAEPKASICSSWSQKFSQFLGRTELSCFWLNVLRSTMESGSPRSLEGSKSSVGVPPMKSAQRVRMTLKNCSICNRLCGESQEQRVLDMIHDFVGGTHGVVEGIQVFSLLTHTNIQKLKTLRGKTSKRCN